MGQTSGAVHEIPMRDGEVPRAGRRRIRLRRWPVICPAARRLTGGPVHERHSLARVGHPLHEHRPCRQRGDTMSNSSFRSNARRNRRAFLKQSVAAGAASAAIALLPSHGLAFRRDGEHEEDEGGRLTRGDAALLRFAAAA